MEFFMEKLNLKTRKNQKGITLVALVITIIILLILAGIVISSLTGENGILTRANDSKTQTEIGKEKEILQLAYTSAIINNEQIKFTKEYLDNELDKIVR